VKPDDSGIRTLFDVRTFGAEELDTRARPDLMARIAQDSGGAVIDASNLDAVAQQFSQHMTDIHPPLFVKTAAWDKWWIMTAMLGLWALAWAVRRAGGLV
jgi:hypothetical protein